MWARFDDNYFTSPAVAVLSDRAFRVHCKAWEYAARNLSDGFIPLSETVGFGKAVIAELVGEELWVVADGGYLLPDFLDANDSREKVLERRRKDSARKVGGTPDGIPDGSPDGTPSGIRTDSRYGKGLGSGVGLEVQEPQPRDQVSFDAFWAAYPRKVGKIAARAKFDIAAKKVDPAVIVAAAERLRDDPNLPDQFHIPHAKTWLSDGRWDDPPLASEANGHKPSPHRLDQHYSRLRGITDGR